MEVMFTTYYFDVYKDVETRKTTGDVPAGDGGGFTGNPGIAPNFCREVAEDIIPAVELKCTISIIPCRCFSGEISRNELPDGRNPPVRRGKT